MALKVIEQNLKAQKKTEAKKLQNVYSFFQMSKVGQGSLKR